MGKANRIAVLFNNIEMQKKSSYKGRRQNKIVKFLKERRDKREDEKLFKRLAELDKENELW